MGLKEKLFGAKDKSPAEDVCAECGMTDGEHTDWCPSQTQKVDVEEAWEHSMTPPAEEETEPKTP